MRKLLVLVLAAIGTPALAQDMSLPTINNFYLQGAAGLRIPDNLRYDGTAEDLGIGTTLGASFGVDTSIPGVSFDLDYLRSSANYTGLGTSLDSQSLMVDGQYTLDLNMGIKPYAALGLGGVNVTYKSADSGNALGYQVKLGAAGPITDQLSWFGEYRYQQAFGDVSVGSPAYPVEYASHSLLGGLKISFGGGSSSGGYTGY
ncbi:MAG: outer membrane beta-barrel protein [Devosia sp.]|nr:outer membrane beta-barrel protein [Devosia sp.]